MMKLATWGPCSQKSALCTEHHEGKKRKPLPATTRKMCKKKEKGNVGPLSRKSECYYGFLFWFIISAACKARGGGRVFHKGFKGSIGRRLRVLGPFASTETCVIFHRTYIRGLNSWLGSRILLAHPPRPSSCPLPCSTVLFKSQL